MIRALGFSENPFEPSDPGRLCRGRERWIEPWEMDTPAAPLVRTVVSGATFSDDGAADAQRGLQRSGVTFLGALEALFPGAKADSDAWQYFHWIAFMEDGHPADIPTEAQGVEAYDGFRAGGRQELGLVRWFLPIEDAEALQNAFAGEVTETEIRGLVRVQREVDVDELMAKVFELVGFSTLDSPPARYQPAALPDLLELADAVVLLHRDKHGPALTAYTVAPIPGVAERMRALCALTDTLVVPFAIPPMLARWDRALAELRAGWPEDAPFPVPRSPDASNRPPSWRDGRRWRGQGGAWFRDDEVIVPAGDEVGEGQLGEEE